MLWPQSPSHNYHRYIEVEDTKEIETISDGFLQPILKLIILLISGTKYSNKTDYFMDPVGNSKLLSLAQYSRVLAIILWKSGGSRSQFETWSDMMLVFMDSVGMSKLVSLAQYLRVLGRDMLQASTGLFHIEIMRFMGSICNVKWYGVTCVVGSSSGGPYAQQDCSPTHYMLHHTVKQHYNTVTHVQHVFLSVIWAIQTDTETKFKLTII